MLQFLRLNHSKAGTLYEVLELPRTCSLTEIKLQFKKLSKKYHPDLNNHLEDEDKKVNSDQFMKIVDAYETLKDKHKKAEYDRSLSTNEWENSYYGESRNSGGSRLNRTRHRVHSFNDTDESTSTFSGEHKNYGDRFNVPHFNYNEHLSKHLKFEQRIINKKLTKQERDAILQQLTKNADLSDVSEELITKHLMRQVNRKAKGESILYRSTSNMSSSNPFMYQKPSTVQYGVHENETDYDDGSTLKAMVIIGGTTGSLFLALKWYLGN
ncbi:DnaJ-domain-containing protein [Yamadazyma tenuis ATCC 10573]|uniref:DnaJ-domain-containing protein n=1 Tax=Candida tenuis (strain ATCC 10573 / BCRC 21748 / CBS 615 / JCM 9827 / NBRC 10315 / NRRL Y-1498 / VKM Y-70) TaxID=590646 RepID=G3B1E7_CANTC|nr:DnaJ-domain-containing protein [Yamadazyma tenuis ATCC 10573]EGV64953.1 DnaJ-domain-containing protein [Yamadazyma tenuis ATCC 10573]